jgi:predicted membrane GTPase involved in stress response
LTSSAIAARLQREAISNIALEVKTGTDTAGESIEVHARGELQLAVLIETMRREGFEMSVSPPMVLFKQETDPETGRTVRMEPYEQLMVDVGEEHTGVVIERCAARKAELKEFVQIGGGKARLEFYAPSRGLIGEEAQTLSLPASARALAHSPPAPSTPSPQVCKVSSKLTREGQLCCTVASIAMGPTSLSSSERVAESSSASVMVV